MRWLVWFALAALTGCGHAAYEHEVDAPSEPPSAGERPVKRWLIVTNGDQPPSCHERLAADGLGPDEDPLGIPFEIVHLNELEGVRLVSLSYTVDGACAFSWDYDPGGQSDPHQLNVVRGELSGGEHEVALLASYGAKLGPPHLRDLRFEMHGTFLVNLDSATRLFVTSYERGVVTTPLEKRVALRFELGELSTPPVLLRPRE